MPHYCIMGNPGSGNHTPALKHHEVDAVYPIKFLYFEASNDEEGYKAGIAYSMSRDDDGCYVFACDDDYKIVGQVYINVPERTETTYDRR